VLARSTAFKFFSSPLASVVVTDNTGAIIDKVEATTLAMNFGYGNVKGKIRRARKDIEPNEFCNAAYVFFRLQLCSYRQGFDRTIKENNGSRKIVRGPFAGNMYPRLEREIEELAKQLPNEIDSLGVAIGRRFEFLGWQSIRLQ